MLNMTDPEVQVFSRPIFKNEVEEAGDINFASHKMHIGFAIYKRDIDEFSPIPPEVIERSGINQGTSNVKSTSFVSCKNHFTGVEGLGKVHQSMIDVGSCIDADNAFVQGTHILNGRELRRFEIALTNSNE